MTSAETALQRLPRGRHGLPGEFVADNQRRRLLAAMAASCAEKGYAKTSVADVVEGAQVSRKTFYEQFDDKQECALEAFDAYSEELTAVVERACKTQAAWPDRVRAGIEAALERFAADRAAAHFLTVGVIAVGPKGVAAQYALFERLSRGLLPGRKVNPQLEGLPPETEWGLVAYLSMLVSRRVTSDSEDLAGLAPELVQAALTPYIGLEAAASAAGRSPG